jgi:hypothetical protein|nr:MAG TPA: hypothetical protein [Caudoviricetes sp.]
MRKKYAKKQLQEVIANVNKIAENSTVCFQKPIIPGNCPTFDEGIANYVRKEPELYLKSWIIRKRLSRCLAIRRRSKSN